MTDNILNNGQGSGTDLKLFDINTFVSNVYASFSQSNRERISRDVISQVVAELDLIDDISTRQTPRLRIHRLRFIGEKRLHNSAAKSINYDQHFASGVNVILIPDNDVGKSSIMKTIKFALTGDNSDYDADVRKWIRTVWLVFALEKRVYTIIIEQADGELNCVLAPGEVLQPISEIAADTPCIFDVQGTDLVQEQLKDFFFQNLALTPLSWNQNERDSNHPIQRSTSWLTYFQALHFADGGHQYLICDMQHAMGNQDGLIVSTFLNLSLTKLLNQVSVKLSQARRLAQQEQSLSAEDQHTIGDQIAQMERTIQLARTSIASIIQTQQERRVGLATSDVTHQLTLFQKELVQCEAELDQLEHERTTLTDQIKRVRSTARRYREQAALTLHFTGLTVRLCPNCDTPVSAEAVVREQSTHECRLCGTPASAMDGDQISLLEAEAERAEQEVTYLERGRVVIGDQIRQVQSKLNTLKIQIPQLIEAVDKGVDLAFPTDAENEEQERLFIEIGRCQAEIAALRAKLTARQPDIEANGIRVRILEKIRDHLKNEADQRNEFRLNRLGVLTQEFATQIGAETISNLNCTALGKLQLRKHGELVSFGGIRNEGERLRVKLAFFTAMMRLGREPGLGRHPGFLMIDQPGSAEMVTEDFQALAAIFREIDQDYADDMQIICFTARQEFSGATDPNKVYGAKDSPFAF